MACWPHIKRWVMLTLCDFLLCESVCGVHMWTHACLHTHKHILTNLLVYLQVCTHPRIHIILFRFLSIIFTKYTRYFQLLYYSEPLYSANYWVHCFPLFLIFMYMQSIISTLPPLKLSDIKFVDLFSLIIKLNWIRSCYVYHAFTPLKKTTYVLNILQQLTATSGVGCVVYFVYSLTVFGALFDNKWDFL